MCLESNHCFAGLKLKNEKAFVMVIKVSVYLIFYSLFCK